MSYGRALPETLLKLCWKVTDNCHMDDLQPGLPDEFAGEVHLRPRIYRCVARLTPLDLLGKETVEPGSKRPRGRVTLPEGV
jgi:hypothetical protein